MITTRLCIIDKVLFTELATIWDFARIVWKPNPFYFIKCFFFISSTFFIRPLFYLLLCFIYYVIIRSDVIICNNQWSDIFTREIVLWWWLKKLLLSNSIHFFCPQWRTIMKAFPNHLIASLHAVKTKRLQWKIKAYITLSVVYYMK